MSADAGHPDAILDFWFREAGPKRWYATDPAFDAVVRRRFARLIETEAGRFDAGPHPWLDEAESALALILLFDQFPRNVWRGSGRAFAYDARGRAAARQVVDSGLDFELPRERRAFIYMPFMHSEDLADQETCIGLVRSRLGGGGTLDHALKHKAVIARFGRFPYRNDALGRTSTKEEVAYLEGGGYAPGHKGPANSAGGQDAPVQAHLRLVVTNENN